MLMKDESDEFKRQRELLEYQISFVPGSVESVQRIWDERRAEEAGTNRVSSSADDLQATLDMIRNQQIDDVVFRPFGEDK